MLGFGCNYWHAKPAAASGIPDFVPAGAAFAADLVSGRYWHSGRPRCSRASGGTAFAGDGRLVVFGENEPRLTSRGLLIEEGATNLCHWFSTDPLVNFPVRPSVTQVEAPGWAPITLGRWARIPHALPTSTSLYGNMGIWPAESELTLNVSAFVHAPGGPPLIGTGETDELGIGCYAGGFSHAGNLRTDFVGHDIYRVSGVVGRKFGGNWMAPALIHAVYSGRAETVERLSLNGFQATLGSRLYSPIISSGAPAMCDADLVTLAATPGRYQLHLRFDDGSSAILPDWEPMVNIPPDLPAGRYITGYHGMIA